MGDGFNADPEDLKRVAEGDLDTIINDHVVVAKKCVSATTMHDPEAFSGGGEVTRVESGFRDARDLLVRVLEENAENLGLAKKALVEVADRYIESDETARTAVRVAERGSDELSR